ncbi:MAG TPA: hypothetical protein VF472_22340 [Burkholderiaceae bacterium]
MALLLAKAAIPARYAIAREAFEMSGKKTICLLRRLRDTENRGKVNIDFDESPAHPK